MPKVSAGLVLYRYRDDRLQVLLVHPGGPFWARKDAGAWSIPKGEAEPNEELLAVALREVREETGFAVDGPFAQLAPVKQSNKIVHAWAARCERESAEVVSNAFRIEYPPRSGRIAEFPEIDRAEWFDYATACEKILPTQRPLLDEFFKSKAALPTPRL